MRGKEGCKRRGTPWMACWERSSLLLQVRGMVTWKRLEIHDSEIPLSILNVFEEQWWLRWKCVPVQTACCLLLSMTNFSVTPFSHRQKCSNNTRITWGWWEVGCCSRAQPARGSAMAHKPKVLVSSQLAGSGGAWKVSLSETWKAHTTYTHTPLARIHPRATWKLTTKEAAKRGLAVWSGRRKQGFW